jgi:hypothetical protein
MKEKKDFFFVRQNIKLKPLSRYDLKFNKDLQMTRTELG